MIVFISGGSKSGKSKIAEAWSSKLRKKDERLIYLATMKPCDSEDLKRIEKHIEDRKKYNFKTFEINKNIENIVDSIKSTDTVLLDSITSLVTNEMFSKGNINLNVSGHILNGINNIFMKAKNLIIVSDYIFSDSTVYDEFTENFRRELGHINTEISIKADVVCESLYKNITVYKGEELLKYEKLI
ncbi:MAG: bifunctional adenosylcobinamide kinase/adenosylcobinamide-phosphate guanylyltransferase [Clostridium sp.]|uniref:bifunctional adenosylcobinamide kinase/adenosylcobinamide-phosphate guanylyltransferase n=1 Tax=Clostridium sp. TaxID=1506 RepID=UPI003F3476A0